MGSNEVPARAGISSDESGNAEFEFRPKLSNYAFDCICSRSGPSIEDRSIRNVEEEFEIEYKKSKRVRVEVPKYWCTVAAVIRKLPVANSSAFRCTASVCSSSRQDREI